ncbi:MAG: Spore cortex peptidoglycan biosynthesis regulator SpoVE [Gemmatimonadetes bacterium]|nr:Spore cortex peptidoglycan biosynthesis regulator SpoVE [Gemmatimonadota bacterium]
MMKSAIALLPGRAAAKASPRKQDAARKPAAPKGVDAPRLRSVPATAAATGEVWETRALLLLVLVAFGFGLLELYSASAFMARAEGLPGHYFALKQLGGAACGAVLCAVLARMDYHRWERWAWPILLVVSLMLLVVIAPGTHAIAPRINGARRWLNLGIRFQPSEFAKLALIFWTAMMAVKKEDRLHSMSKGLLPFLVVWLGVILLVFREPNMSAALLLALLASLVLFAGGARIGHFILLGMVAVPVVWHAINSADYRMKRIVAFLDPAADPAGVSYQIYQSLIAVGSGGLSGVGYGASRQKYGFLPEPHNDFLFSMIAEEWGIFGIVLTVALFGAFLWVGYRIAARAPDRFGYLVGIGMTNLIAVSAFLHMGVALALLPTTGVALPFMSYGRSALLADFAAVGILLAVARATRNGPAAAPAKRRAA